MIALRLGHADLDAVAVLFRLHLDRGDIVVVAPALLDDHLNVGLVPGPDLDRAVEGGQRHIGLARDREMLLVALDVLVQVGADDVDAARGGEQRRERRRQRKSLDVERTDRTMANPPPGLDGDDGLQFDRDRNGGYGGNGITQSSGETEIRGFLCYSVSLCDPVPP